MVSNVATQEELNHKLAVGKTEELSDLCHTITKVFRNCPYQALLENKSEGQFIVNVLKTHLDPYISFPPQTALCSAPQSTLGQSTADSVSEEGQIRGHLDWGGGGEETTGTVELGLYADAWRLNKRLF